ncbi:hypothetical protein JW710_01045 [Candidatus Dojkabacteria bacterium]|nr:hypothetical protein [Candidatus Dojkabacteria bacterium]
MKKEKSADNDRSKLILKISIIAGAVLLILGVVVFLILRSSSGESSTPSESEEDSFVSFVPVWAAIFPAIYAGRKRKEVDDNSRKWLLIFVGVTALLVVISIVAWIIFASR